MNFSLINCANLHDFSFFFSFLRGWWRLRGRKMHEKQSLAPKTWETRARFIRDTWETRSGLHGIFHCRMGASVWIAAGKLSQWQICVQWVEVRGNDGDRFWECDREKWRRPNVHFARRGRWGIRDHSHSDPLQFPHNSPSDRSLCAQLDTAIVCLLTPPSKNFPLRSCIVFVLGDRPSQREDHLWSIAGQKAFFVAWCKITLSNKKKRSRIFLRIFLPVGRCVSVLWISIEITELTLIQNQKNQSVSDWSWCCTKWSRVNIHVASVTMWFLHNHTRYPQHIVPLSEKNWKEKNLVAFHYKKRSQI